MIETLRLAHAASIRVAEKIGMHHEEDFSYEGLMLALYAWSA